MTSPAPALGPVPALVRVRRHDNLRIYHVAVSTLVWGVDTRAATIRQGLVRREAIQGDVPYLVVPGDEKWAYRVTVLPLERPSCPAGRDGRHSRGRVLHRVQDLDPPASQVVDRLLSPRKIKAPGVPIGESCRLTFSRVTGEELAKLRRVFGPFLNIFEEGGAA